MNEIWRRYRNSYEVSNLGRVRSLNGVIIRSRLDHGYVRLNGIYVHRMVAEAFFGPSGLPVDHINAVKSDNRVVNLEYVTDKENDRRARAKGLSKNPQSKLGEDHYLSKLTKQQCEQIRALYASGKYSQRDLAAQFNVKQGNIFMIVHRKTWKIAGGAAVIVLPGNGRMTPEQVREIRGLASTMNYSQIGRRYDLTSVAVKNIISRKAWRHIQ